MCTLVLFAGGASANEVLSARGPVPEDSASKTAVALGGGLLFARDGRRDAPTLPYLEFFLVHSFGAHGDFEMRVTSTGATFGELGGRVRFGEDAFSMGARFGAIGGLSLRGPIDGLYGGAFASTGTKTFQASFGLDVLWFESESRPREDRSNLELRPFVGIETAVGKSTSFYMHCVYYTRYGDPFFKYGAPAFAVGAAW